MKLAADAGQNGRWVRDAQKASSPANRSKAAKGMKSQERRREQNSQPGCDNGPIRESGTWLIRKAVTNDPRGRRLHQNQCTYPETRGAKNRKGEATNGVGAQVAKRRSGMARRLVTPGGTAQPVNAEGNK